MPLHSEMILCVGGFKNSYSIALMKSGFDNDQTNIISIGIDDNGNEYRVVKSYDADQNAKLAYLVKNDVDSGMKAYTLHFIV